MRLLLRTAPTWIVMTALLAVPPAVAQESSPPDAPTTAVPPAKTPDPIPNEPWRANDKRRTLRSYGTNLVHAFTGVVSGENAKTLLIVTAFTLPSFTFDENAIDYFERHPHEDFGKIGASLGGGIAVAGMTVGFFSAGRYAHGDRFRAATYDASQAVIVTQVYTQVGKFVARRRRPDGSNRQSFPSGHSSNAFTVAAVAAHHYPRLALPAYALSTYIAVSRLAASKHHVSDIVAGSGLGFSIGKIVVHRNARPPDAPPLKSLNVAPDAGPSGDGAGLALHLSF